MTDLFHFKRAACVGLAVLLSVSLPVQAHHSFAMFDFEKNVTIKATVKEFQWANPHVVLYVYADAPQGKEPELWALELTSPGNLTRGGWTRKAFKTGDRVELEISPLRDGNRGGAFRKGTVLETGQVWTSNLRAAEKPGLE